MKMTIIEIQRQIEFRLRRLCGKPTQMKRLVIVLVACTALAFANIYYVVSSVNNIGKNDKEKELIKLQHIMMFELQKNSLEHKDFKKLKEIEEYDEQLSNTGRE